MFRIAAQLRVVLRTSTRCVRRASGSPAWETAARTVARRLLLHVHPDRVVSASTSQQKAENESSVADLQRILGDLSEGRLCRGTFSLRFNVLDAGSGAATSSSLRHISAQVQLVQRLEADRPAFGRALIHLAEQLDLDHELDVAVRNSLVQSSSDGDEVNASARSHIRRYSASRSTGTDADDFRLQRERAVDDTYQAVRHALARDPRAFSQDTDPLPPPQRQLLGLLRTRRLLFHRTVAAADRAAALQAVRAALGTLNPAGWRPGLVLLLGGGPALRWIGPGARVLQAPLPLDAAAVRRALDAVDGGAEAAAAAAGHVGSDAVHGPALGPRVTDAAAAAPSDAAAARVAQFARDAQRLQQRLRAALRLSAVRIRVEPEHVPTALALLHALAADAHRLQAHDWRGVVLEVGPPLAWHPLQGRLCVPLGCSVVELEAQLRRWGEPRV